MNKEFLRLVSIELLNAAKQMELDAGYGGRMDSGGADRIRALAAGIEYAITGITADPAINNIVGKVERIQAKTEAMKDPEWAEFVRLKSKFKNVE